MEKFLINRIWTIAFILWILIFLTWLIPLFNLPTLWFISDLFWVSKINTIISTQYMFTTIWAIFAFWYWYKKYERDKELEIIEKYTKKYNTIKVKEVSNFNEENCKLLFDLWYEEFYLKSKWYISDELWNEWMWWIYIDILKIIKIDSSIFINIMAEFYQYNDKTNIKYNDKNYLLFIQNIIKKILENSKKWIKTLEEDTFDSILLTEKEKYIKEKYIIEYNEVIVFCEKSLKHMKNFYKVTN